MMDRTRMDRTRMAAVLAVVALSSAACAGAAASDRPDPADPAPSAGMCAPESPDCVDTVVVPDTGDPDPVDLASTREVARAMLGAAEGDLDDGVRVARRGDEHLMLTEDHVVGRLTVELDPDADGVHRVVLVRIEVPDGAETIVP
jgi:hypothetical protein